MIHHNSTVSHILCIQKNTTFLKECIYVINIDMNDYIYNYFATSPDYRYDSSELYLPEEYIDVLMVQYYQQLKVLYNLGGRKVSLFGLDQLGCTPLIVKRWPPKGRACKQLLSDVVYVFNNKLKTLVEGLIKDKPDARFTFINTTSILQKKECKQ
ncbi:putative triacylglycerol lipase [Helianthus anomalus]